MNARDFLRLFMETREVCESVPRGSKERKVAKRLRGGTGVGGEGEFSRGSRVKLHLRDSYSLHVACDIMRAFTTKVSDNFR